MDIGPRNLGRKSIPAETREHGLEIYGSGGFPWHPTHGLPPLIRLEPSFIGPRMAL